MPSCPRDTPIDYGTFVQDVFDNLDVVHMNCMQQAFGQILRATKLSIDKSGDVFEDSGSTYFSKLLIQLFGPGKKQGHKNFGSEIVIPSGGTAGGTDISTLPTVQ